MTPSLHGALLPAALGASLLVAVAAVAGDSSVPYPVNYRNWDHVKSMLIGKGHPLFDSFGGLHHIYANKAGREGYARGKFPDGATLVFDLLSVAEADGAVTEGPRKVVGVMEKDRRRFAATGGWGFEAFEGDTRKQLVGDKAAEACFACHQAQESKDFVFSAYRP